MLKDGQKVSEAWKCIFFLPKRKRRDRVMETNLPCPHLPHSLPLHKHSNQPTKKKKAKKRKEPYAKKRKKERKKERKFLYRPEAN
jgi:hypothetical protein